MAGESTVLTAMGGVGGGTPPKRRKVVASRCLPKKITAITWYRHGRGRIIRNRRERLFLSTETRNCVQKDTRALGPVVRGGVGKKKSAKKKDVTSHRGLAEKRLGLTGGRKGGRRVVDRGW